MSLWLYDPLRDSSLSRHLYNPMMREMAQIERSLDHFFDEPSQQLRIRDHAGQITNNENGFQYRVDCHGFKNNEIKVDLEGQDIVIKGEHKSVHENEAVHRSFVRRVTLPKGIQKEAIKCDLDENGRLVLCAPKAAIADSQKRSIPIEMKKNGAEAETK